MSNTKTTTTIKPLKINVTLKDVAGYEAEKQAREQEENELSENKRLIEEMKKEIERKREEQKAIEELNQKVAKALKFQKQIEENRRAALEEEEEPRK